jgi:hypothetical protein
MAHFAQIDENNIVTQVIVIKQEKIDTGHWGDPDTWIQTSYNTRAGVHYTPNSAGVPDGGIPLRKNYAGIGCTYDKGRDAFISPKPYDSWKLNEDKCVWEAPVNQPDDGKIYDWNESKLIWELNNERTKIYEEA